MTQEETIQKLNELTKDIHIAQFTTIGLDGTIVSRPMGTQEMDEEGNIWFFTERDSTKIKEIEKESKVNVSYSDGGKNKYVSVIGKAQTVDDRAKVKELWSEFLKAWFPKGVDDPNIILIKVVADKAEYWEYPGGIVTELVGFVKAVTTGEPADDLGENKKVTL